jgi:hypothetical protein
MGVVYMYEDLLEEVHKHDIILDEKYVFKNDELKGVYCDEVILLNKNLQSTKEKACVLAEELGHHHTTIGNILNQKVVSNRKQELKARLWSYDKLIGLTGLIRAYNHGCSSSHEIAEVLEVTEDFLIEALDAYRKKYGEFIVLDQYIIYFEPSLGIMRRI